MTMAMGEGTRRPDQSRYLKLIPPEVVKERMKLLLRSFQSRVEQVSVDASFGRVCAEQVRARWSIPHANIAAMDGYAVRSEDSKAASLSNPIILRVCGAIYPGVKLASDRSALNLGGMEAFYVSTGAPLPRGADAVARLEDTKVSDNCRVILTHRILSWKNVVKEGADVKGGQMILAKGEIVNPAQVALLIAAGRERIRVTKRPAIAILSIGDEIRQFRSGASNQPKARRANPETIFNNFYNLLRGYLERWGANVTSLGVCGDDVLKVSKSIEESIDNFDMTITIGGSSVGKKDLTPDAVRSLVGSEEIFHGIRLLPIKPSGLYVVHRKGGKKLVAVLPGHSVSAALALFVVVLPALNVLSGLRFDSRRVVVRAKSTEEFSNDRAITALYLGRVALDENNNFQLTPLGWGSNILSSLAKANGFVEVPPHCKVEKGAPFNIQLFSESGFLRVNEGSRKNIPT